MEFEHLLQDDADAAYLLLRALVFVSIALLIYGWRNRNPHGHRVSMIGWFLFGLFWLFNVPHFLDNGEEVNAVYCVLGFPLFLFLAYHEHLSISRDDDPSSLPFMAGTVGIAAGMYFLIDTFPVVAAFFVWTTAVETAVFLDLIGYDSHVGGVAYEEIVRVPIFHGDEGGISIILACTAIQSIVIFIAAILTTTVTKDPGWKKLKLPRFVSHLTGTTHFNLTRKWKAFLCTVPIILILNIVRTAAVIYLVYEGHAEFDFAHNGLSRWGSMLVLIILAYWMFDILPELHDNIIGIPMLIKRGKEKPSSDQGSSGSTDHPALSQNEEEKEKEGKDEKVAGPGPEAKAAAEEVGVGESHEGDDDVDSKELTGPKGKNDYP